MNEFLLRSAVNKGSNFRSKTTYLEKIITCETGVIVSTGENRKKIITLVLF